MSNDEYADWVHTLNQSQLLDEVMENPEYLTDYYYHPLGRALRARYNELKEMEIEKSSS